MTSASDEPRSLRTLGRFELVKVLGRGGMSVVYEALDPKLGRRVAVKRVELSPGASEADRIEAWKLFAREAHLHARVEHPGVVPIYEVSEGAEAPFLVMELIEGGSLADWIENSPPLTTLVTTFTQVARTLAAVHEKEILHRDLKPSNILLRRDGTPLIADFGIAREQWSADLLTRTGFVRCTPGYASPEQLGDYPLKPRADVYGLGATLFHVLAGQLPTPERENRLAALSARKVPDSLAAIVLRALAAIDERTPTARALADELEAWAQGRPVPEPARAAASTNVPSPTSRRTLSIVTLFGALFLVAAALAPWTYRWWRNERLRAMATYGTNEFSHRTVDVFRRVERVTPLDYVDVDVAPALDPVRPEGFTSTPEVWVEWHDHARLKLGSSFVRLEPGVRRVPIPTAGWFSPAPRFFNVVLVDPERKRKIYGRIPPGRPDVIVGKGIVVDTTDPDSQGNPARAFKLVEPND